MDLNRDQLVAALLASLAAAGDQSESGIETEDGYIDWTSVDHSSGRRGFEIGKGDDAIVLWLTLDEVIALQRKLTLTMLAETTIQ